MSRNPFRATALAFELLSELSPGDDEKRLILAYVAIRPSKPLSHVRLASVRVQLALRIPYVLLERCFGNHAPNFQSSVFENPCWQALESNWRFVSRMCCSRGVLQTMRRTSSRL